MSKDNSGPAFPTEHNGTGMTLRDYFAAMAMQGTIASSVNGEEYNLVTGPRWAYRLADAMMEARRS